MENWGAIAATTFVWQAKSSCVCERVWWSQQTVKHPAAEEQCPARQANATKYPDYVVTEAAEQE